MLLIEKLESLLLIREEHNEFLQQISPGVQIRISFYNVLIHPLPKAEQRFTCILNGYKYNVNEGGAISENAMLQRQPAYFQFTALKEVEI